MFLQNQVVIIQLEILSQNKLNPNGKNSYYEAGLNENQARCLESNKHRNRLPNQFIKPHEQLLRVVKKKFH